MTDPATISEGELPGRTFLSESLTGSLADGTPRTLVEGTRISLEFTGDGELAANAGCNNLFGAVSIGAGTLEIDGLGGTEMGCDPPRHAQDQWLTEFLQSSPTWLLSADRLTLTGGGTELVLLDRRVADPDRPLAGTRWEVDTIITGEAASSMFAGTEGSAWLVIEDESFTASSGCREITGRVIIDGARLRFTDAVQTDPACPPELEQVDDVMVTILGSEAEFEIDARRLRLDHADGVGLGLSAGE